MTTQYSGRVTDHAHKFDDWRDHDVSGAADCIQTAQIFYVQWSNCPVEVEKEVVEIWKNNSDLRNDSFFSWNRDAEYWDETMEDEDAEEEPVKTMAEVYPLIDEYLMSRGISKILINYWW